MFTNFKFDHPLKTPVCKMHHKIGSEMKKHHKLVQNFFLKQISSKLDQYKSNIKRSQFQGKQHICSIWKCDFPKLKLIC